MRDSNPRYPEEGIPDFESSAFGHSANLPKMLLVIQQCKDNAFLVYGKIYAFFFNNINIR